MALEATHIKFALDLKHNFNITDLSAYICGTIYPDSRYISGIDRNLTHSADDILSLRTTDFTIGWFMHIVCDTAGNQLFKKLIPELGVNLSRHGQYSEWWITMTSIKIVLDLELLTTFDVKEYLPLLMYAENPNNEPIEKIREYHRIIQNLYQDHTLLTDTDFKNMWLEFGIPQELAEQILARTRELLADTLLVKKIGMLYQEMIHFGQTKINTTLDLFGSRL